MICLNDNTGYNLFMKQCCTCKEIKPDEDFGRLKSTKDGLAKSCKLCARIRVANSKAKHPETVKRANNSIAAKARIKRFYEINPEKSKEYTSKRYITNRDEILKYHKELSKRPDQVEKRKAYYEENKGYIIKRSSDYQRANSEHVNKKNKKWRAANPDKSSEYYQAYKNRHPGKTTEQRRLWKKSNPHLVTAATALRRAKKKNATPYWANSFFINEAYQLARLRTSIFGFKWEVDHIIPLQSPIVCGLHVENNLQVIPATVNRFKGNKVLNHG